MPEQYREWFEKAEGDFDAAVILMAPPRGKPNVNAVCFHSPQCIEKYLKGFLVAHNIYFDKTHDLVTLLDLAVPFQPFWESWRSGFTRLKGLAVEFRYPGEWADPAIATFALYIATAFRVDVRELYGLSLDSELL